VNPLTPADEPRNQGIRGNRCPRFRGFLGGSVVALVAAHVATSALHFFDNATRFGHYHDEATAVLNPTTVVVAWVLQTALGLIALVLFRRGRAAGRPLLLLYGTLGLAGLLHYAAPPSHAMGFAMHGLIALEAATGVAVVVAVALGRRISPSGASAPPFAAFK
jgi:hypothetical protein